MSFDIYLIGFSEGKSVDLAKEQVRAVLQKHSLEPLGNDSFNVNFPDGSHVELSASGLNDSGKFECCAFNIINMSDAIVRFVFEVAKAGKGALLPTMEPTPCILVDASLKESLPADLALPIVECESPEALIQLLAGGYKKWSAYRDYVTNKQSPSDSKV